MSLLPTKRAGNAGDKRPEPGIPPVTIPTRPPPPPSVADPRALHPAVQAHAVAWSDMLQEADDLRETVRKLTNDLQVQREINQKLEFMLQDERTRLGEFDRLKDKYMRFAQEILTESESARDHLDKAIRRAMDAAHKHEPAERQAVEAQFEKAVADAVEPAALAAEHQEGAPE